MQAACWSLQHSFLAHFITFCPGFKTGALSTPVYTLDRTYTIQQTSLTEIKYITHSQMRKTLYVSNCMLMA